MSIMTDKAAELEKKLAALKQTYIAQLDERIEALETALQDILAGSDFASAKEGLEQLAFHAHKLSGTAGTFGFNALGQNGATIEIMCDEFVKIETGPTEAEKEKLGELVAACRSVADTAE
jgi:HPt (histidine-containing phosphotransfer) domain-containing protein